MRATALAAPVLVLALGLSGCGSSQPLRPDLFYSLEPAMVAGTGGAPAPVVLLVNNLGARGFLGGRAIVFRTSDQPLVAQRYEELLWEDPPSRAVAQALVGAIRSAGIVEVVVVPADRAHFDLLLGGEVERFEHRPTDSPPRVAATINLALVRATDRATLASRQYSGEEPVTGDTPDAMAEAFNRLTARLMTEVVRDLQALKPRLAPSPAPRAGAV
ncbi:MAG: ABC-type transport auxiliary lipoprotein family protein [Bdellovibrio bacteriovorus]